MFIKQTQKHVGDKTCVNHVPVESVATRKGPRHRSRTALAAEDLFLRKQLALYRDRPGKPRRASDPLRLALVLLARCFAWRETLTIGQPATLLRWHRQAFRSSGAGGPARAARASRPSCSI